MTGYSTTSVDLHWPKPSMYSEHVNIDDPNNNVTLTINGILKINNVKKIIKKNTLAGSAPQVGLRLANFLIFNPRTELPQNTKFFELTVYAKSVAYSKRAYHHFFCFKISNNTWEFDSIYLYNAHDFVGDGWRDRDDQLQFMWKLDTPSGSNYRPTDSNVLYLLNVYDITDYVITISNIV
jgi:hypothetical protein